MPLVARCTAFDSGSVAKGRRDLGDPPIDKSFEGGVVCFKHQARPTLKEGGNPREGQDVWHCSSD